MNSRFMRGEKGQAAQVVIVTAALIIVSFSILNALYEGSVADFHINESKGNMTANQTEFTMTNTPISDVANLRPTCYNQSISFARGIVGCDGPCLWINSTADGVITVNNNGTTGINVTYDVITCDYFQTRVTGTGLTTGVTVAGYMWTGVAFLGLALLVLGAVFVIRIVRQMGG